MKTTTLPSQEYLNECFTYDPATGKLYWKNRPVEHFKNKRAHAIWSGRFPNQPALDCLSDSGYRTGTLNGKRYKAHRVIYKLLHGTDPEMIDHSEGDRSDNRPELLSSCTILFNNKNQKIRSTNKSGVMGVCWHTKIGKWQVYANNAGKREHLGYFENIDEAIEVRKAAETKFNYHENHGREI